MSVSEIHNQREWNDFLLYQPTQAGIFLQSYEWLSFQESLGRKVWRLGVRCQVLGVRDEMVGVCGVVKMELPMGSSYLYAPRGPVLAISNFQFPISKEIPNCKLQIPEVMIDSVRRIAQKEKAMFWRFEPPIARDMMANEFRRSPKFVRQEIVYYPTHPVQPTQTLIVDITKSEGELLAAMHEKTRYNVRLALRKGVETRNLKLSSRGGPALGGETGNVFDEFWKLMRETARRDGFRTHERGYYETMLRVLHNPSQPPLTLRGGDDRDPPLKVRGGEGGVMSAQLHMAYHGTTPLAGAIVSYFGDTATYLHGASSYEHRALMGPYALHWEIMRDAKAEGYKYYDFWGVQSADSRQLTADSSSRKPFAVSRKHDWSGMTRFKMGFGGKVVNYPGTFDLPVSKFWYTVYRIARRVM